MIEQTIIKFKRKINKKIETGDKFGRLEVIEKGYKKNNHWYYKCRCECGNTVFINGSKLNNGNTKSCKCLRKEMVTKHRLIGSPEYQSWQSMIQRCINPNNSSYDNYGRRGISVCPDWLNSFEKFYMDMGKRPRGLTLERINNDGNYKPSNCKWATRIEQSRNKRKRKDNKTGITGVCWDKRYQKYVAQIMVGNKRYFLGYFDQIKNAIVARETAEEKYWK